MQCKNFILLQPFCVKETHLIGVSLNLYFSFIVTSFVLLSAAFSAGTIPTQAPQYR